ncbi:aspartyl-tRNA(Asn)/glutamyl-tRNA(Gln) amidotransferase subunit A [Paenibacillus sp. V4I9]|uniref:amidase n=1 Tax=Paenibacillus sp. V4I9 TaxID=3042308 RepID=UPI002788E1C5|nr:amidase [Paenibacillus sp. V4I9]MDQ0889816.1 aspartyl-tRNA(Asn)/glutamyl-tRNA(Gln) amidotransferase subunit A [Paenibacillus sp. V4I9]
MRELNSQMSFATIHELAERIRTREVSPVEITELALERIERLNPKLNAFVTQTAELAIEQAKQAEHDIMLGRYKGPLHGIPIVHKDLYYTKGIRTTASSKILKDFVPDYDSTVVTKLHEAGTVLLGKVQTHEFAAGMTTSSPHFGPCRNPWNLELVPGGSSGGSASALAAGLAYLGTGSDTGGSIRMPAACCGVVGMKPTYGRVSRYGIIPMAWSLDHSGPLTRSVMDASLCLDVMSGFDPKDESTVDLPAPGIRRYPNGLKGVRIGLPSNYYYEDLEPEVEASMQAAINKFRELGAEIIEVALPMIRHVQSATMAIMMAEMFAFHEKWLDTNPEDYGPDVRMFLESSRDIPASVYLQSQRARQLIVDDFLNAMSGIDILLTPATPITAPHADDYAGAFRLTTFTIPTNLTGMPSLCMPCGFSPSGMPINMQLIGRPFEEATVLSIGYAYESNTDWHKRHPDL